MSLDPVKQLSPKLTPFGFKRGLFYPPPMSAKGTLKRLEKEKTLFSSRDFQPTENPLVWILTIPGPPGSAYEGAKFALECKFTDLYPFKGPSLSFRTPLFHMNVHSSGIAYCPHVEQWNPSFTIDTIAKWFESILLTPDTKNPYNYEAFELFHENETAYYQRVDAELSKNGFQKNT